MGKIISTEYVHAGEKKDPRIVAHSPHTHRSLKRMLKRAIRSEKKKGSQEKEKENENERAAWNGSAEPAPSRSTATPPLPTRIPSLEQVPSAATAQKQFCSNSKSSSWTSPYPSLREAYPRFKDLLDVGSWPTLPAPTNSVRAAGQPDDIRWRAGQLDLLVRPRGEARDDALPPPHSRREEGRGE